MDVESGRCWRCETTLPQNPVRCSRCPMAVYCCSACRARDTPRHGSVECQIFGPKKCGACGKTGDTKECAQCNAMWYCSKECQQKDWAAHRSSCQQVVAAVKLAAGKLSMRYFAGSRMSSDFPYYIGNTIAKDFLRLDANEWLDKNLPDRELGRDYHILSAGCGNLRNTVMTVASLPTRYHGKLHITLNDTDPFVMARNVLFLYMLVRFEDTKGIASSLATIWYSLHISEREYGLIKTSLEELIPMSAECLRDVTRGLVSVLGEGLESLRLVWQGWQALECRRDKKDSINLGKQRKALFREKNMDANLSLYMTQVQDADKVEMRRWLDQGLFVPGGTKTRDLTFANPTLTGRQRFSLDAGTRGTFVYGVNKSAFPFTEWDCIRVRRSTSGSYPSPMVMYHTYVSSCLQKVCDLIHQERLCVTISLASCLDFPSLHKTGGLPNYDRIFSSNLADYLGIARLLTTFKPLLDSSNNCSAIVTEFMNWIGFLPNAKFVDKGVLKSSAFSSTLAFKDDTYKPEPYSGNIQMQYMYNYNLTYFLVYLRASIMAGGLGIPALQKVPQLTHVMNYKGMQMRDFRKGLNKLVPFKYRVNVRDLTLCNSLQRAVEWCLPKTA